MDVLFENVNFWFLMLVVRNIVFILGVMMFGFSYCGLFMLLCVYFRGLWEEKFVIIGVWIEVFGVL